MKRRTRVGWPAAALGLLVPLYVAALVGVQVWVRTSGMDLSMVAKGAGPLLLASAAGALSLLVLAFSVWVVVRGRRLSQGSRGQFRLVFTGGAAITHLLSMLLAALAGVMVLGAGVFARLLEPSGAGQGLGVENAPPDVHPAVHITYVSLLVISGLSLLFCLLGSLSFWFLLAPRVRKWTWLVLDTIILAGFVAATVTLPLEPASEDPAAMVEPGIRLGITVLFGIRLFARLVPPLLDLVERFGFHPLVAARHLRAKKSSFLAAIGMLSILAVAFSSCSLTTTLSVMGGFRQDLKSKILGNNAHIAIDKKHDSFEGWAPLLEKVRGTPGVESASPYVGGEVMVTSASNLAGGVLRGVDPDTVSRVIDLEENMVQGKLEYLRHPEKLLDLPPEQRRGPTDFQPTTGQGEDPPAPEKGPNDTGPVRDVEGMLPDEPDRGNEPPDKGLDTPPLGKKPSKAVPEVGGVPGTPSGPGDDPSSNNPLEGLGPSGPSDGAGSNKALEGLSPEPAAEESSEDVLPGIVVGRELAKTLRLYVGDEVNVVSPFGELGPSGPMPKSRPFRVAGIFYSGMYEYDMKYTYVTLDTGQRFLSTGDAISGIEVTVDRIERAPEIAESIAANIDRDELRVRDWQQLNRNLFGALELEKLAMFITLGIAILVAGFCVFGTLTLMVQEKGREMAILKAMGTSRSSVVKVFLIEGVLIGVFGAGIGLGLGYAACFAAEHFGIRMNPEVYYIDKLPVHVDGMEFALVGISAAVVCLVATIFPAILASRLHPVDALRYQ